MIDDFGTIRWVRTRHIISRPEFNLGGMRWGSVVRGSDSEGVSAVNSRQSTVNSKCYYNDKQIAAYTMHKMTGSKKKHENSGVCTYVHMYNRRP